MRRCVLVVEDDFPILQMLHDMLTVQGFRPVGVERPDLVLRAAVGARPDLFLIDVMLPGKSGIEIAQELREHGFAHTPMIALSASRMMAKVAETSDVFQAAIVKPFEYDELFAEIRRLLGDTAEAAE
jgi:DNA-binding response OmpR family regulator